MASYLNYFFLLWVLLVRESRSIILCDEGCLSSNNASDLGICMKGSSAAEDIRRTPLLLMGFFPCNSPDFRGRGLTVAGQMAARAVRLNSSILQDYRLEISFNNTMCDRIAGIRSFIDQLREESLRNVTRHMIIGPGCSTGAVTIAETAPFYHLTQISYTATSITLSDKRRFPTFLRTISSDNASIAMISAVLREFRWEQMAIVTLRNELFSNLTAVMLESFTEQGVSVITENLFFDPPGEGETQVFSDIMEQLNVSGARIVLLNVFEDSARQLLCQAYRKGMLYPQYLYITYYWFSEGWWLEPSTSCSVQELTTTINRTIAVDYFPEQPPDNLDALTDVGTTTRNFWRDFQGNISMLNYPANEALRQAGYVYDAVWAAAFALDRTERQLKENGSASLRDFRYGTEAGEAINRLIFNSTMSRSFVGVTGNVSFNEFGDREPTGEIYQFYLPDDGLNYSKDSLPTFEPFAVVDKDEGKLRFLQGNTEQTIFPEGLPFAAEDAFIHLALFIIMTILSVAGLVFAGVCIAFNLIFRKKQLVKLTSPYLNVVSIVGGMFFYMEVILFGIDENVASFTTVDVLCQTRIWIASIGFTLFFGPILAKSFRVYYIFRSIKLKKKPIKDWILLLGVGAMLALDVVFLLVISIGDWRLQLNVNIIPREGGAVPLVIDRCSSESARFWLNILLAYKTVYLLAGLLLASQTYNVRIKGLRDSRLIVVSVFATFVGCVVLAAIGFFVTDDPNAFYGLLASFILSIITCILGLLFIPRMVELQHNPSGEVSLNSVSDTNKSPLNLNVNTSTPTGTVDEKAEIAKLKSTIDSLKEELEKAKRGDPKGKHVESHGSLEGLLSPPSNNMNGREGQGGGGGKNGEAVEMVRYRVPSTEASVKVAEEETTH